jgi:hypothetical protein
VFRISGKKVLPDPEAKKSGILDRGTANSGIGARAILRAFGDILKVRDVRQMPERLSTEPVQVTLPLNLIPYKVVSRGAAFLFGGAPVKAVAVLSVDPGDIDPPPLYVNQNEMRLVGGLSARFVFDALPAVSGDKITIRYRMVNVDEPGPVSDWYGMIETCGVPVDNSQIEYTFAMNHGGGLSADRRAGPMAMPLLGWIPARVKLEFSAFFWDGTTNAPKNFPAGNVHIQFLAVESPRGIIPPV